MMSEVSSKRSPEHLKKKLLKTILSGRLSKCKAICKSYNNSMRERKMKKDILLQKQKFTIPKPKYFSTMCKAFLGVLVMPSLLEPTPKNPERGVTKEDMLDACLRDYEGYLVHVATALGQSELVKELFVQVKDLGGKPAVRYLLGARDSVNHSVLEVAVLRGCHPTMSTLLSRVDLVDSYSRASLYQEAVRNCTSMLHRKRKTAKAAVRYLLFRAQKYIGVDDHSIYSFIYREDFKSLREFVRTIGPVARQDGPHGAHVAAWAYSERRMSSSDRSILEYLLNCTDLPFEERRAATNDVCRLILDDHAQRSGTAAHFAVFRHEADAVNVYKMKPTLWSNSTTSSPRRRGEDDTQVWGNVVSAESNTESTLQILCMLHKYGADFLQGNLEGKTALDLLPPDADPRIVSKLTRFMRLKRMRADAYRWLHEPDEERWEEE